jgi:prepilin peptidase CpaA
LIDMAASAYVPLLVVSGIALVAAATDLWKFKVYNALTLPAIVVGLLVSPFTVGLPTSLLGAATGFSLLALFFALGGVGAGDVKLLTAIGAWLGPEPTLYVFAFSAMAGGMYAIGLMVLRGGLTETIEQLAVLSIRLFTPGLWKQPDERMDIEIGRVDRRKRLVPYAAMICVGFFTTLVPPNLGR